VKQRKWIGVELWLRWRRWSGVLALLVLFGGVGYGGDCFEVFGSGGGWLRCCLAEVFLGLGCCPGASERARYVDTPC
jgi:hypothetical protein